MTSASSPPDRMTMVKWALSFIFPALIYLLCSNAGLPQSHVIFYTITSVALVFWALSLISDTIVAVALPIVYIIFQLGKPGQILNSWSTSVGWIVFGGLIFAQIMMRTGLAKRLSIWALYITRGSFNRLLWGILLAGFIIAPCIPTVMGKAALISVICIGICETLNLEKKSRASSAILLAGFLSIATSKMSFLTGGADVTMLVKQTGDVMGKSVSWGDYFLHNFPLAIIYAAFSMLLLILILRPKLDADVTEYVSKAHAELGPMGTGEKKTGALILLLILLMVTDRFHGIDVGWIMIVLAFVTFLPGVSLMNDANLNKIPLTPIFFVVGCMSIGSTARVLGVDKFLAGTLAPLMEGNSEVMSMFFAYIAGTAVNFLLTPLAAVSSMTVPLAELAMNMGINPIPVVYAFNYGLEQYIFPYEYAVLLFFFASGWISLKHIIMVFAARFAVTGVFLVAVAAPWWKLWGLFEPVVR